MYSVYNYKAGSSTTNVINDISLILTGTTSTASLSSDCVQANTSITASLQPAGWTVWDAAAGTNKIMFRSQNQDSSTYNYFRFGLTSATATESCTCESWNTSTHIGTNVTTVGTSVWDSGAGGYFYIYATSKNIIIMPWTVAGFQAIHIGSELLRENIPAGYPSFITAVSSNVSSMGNLTIPKIKNPNGAGDVTNFTQMNFGLTKPNVTSTYGPTFYRDASENIYIQLLGLTAGFDGYYSNMTSYGKNYDVFVTNATSNNLDEISYGGNTYVCFKATWYLAMPKG